MHPSTPGAIPLDDLGITLTPTMPRAALADALIPHTLTTLGGGEEVALRETRAGGEVMHVTLSFKDDRLARVELCKTLPHDAKGWDGWTLEGERARKTAHEAWVQRLFGVRMTPKPLPVEHDDGRVTHVLPFEITPDTLMHAQLPWGEAVSFMDSKAGFAGLRITYS